MAFQKPSESKLLKPVLQAQPTVPRLVTHGALCAYQRASFQPLVRHSDPVLCLDAVLPDRGQCGLPAVTGCAHSAPLVGVNSHAAQDSRWDVTPDRAS